MNIAFIVHTFDAGGLERCIANLANRLDRRRFRPIIICLARSGTARPWVTADDVLVIELEKPPRNDVATIRRLAKTLRCLEVDVVHSHNWGTLVESAIARRWAAPKLHMAFQTAPHVPLHVPLHVHAEHGLELADLQLNRLKSFLRGRAMAWALRRCDRVVAVCDQVAERLQVRCGYPAGGVNIVPNGIDTPMTTSGDARRHIRDQLRISDDTMLIGSVGRLAPVKNFPLLLEAVNRAATQTARKLALVLVGDGTEHEALASLANRLVQYADRSHVNIHLVGQRANVGDYLAAMDVYANSSLSEGMSLSLLEAMAAGLPLIATDVGENRTLLEAHQRCGIAVPSSSADALANAIGQFADDATTRQQLGHAASEKYRRHYALSNMVMRYADLYQSAVAERGSRPQWNHNSTPPAVQEATP